MKEIQATIQALQAGQAPTREDVQSAYAGATLRDEMRIMVYVECCACGDFTTTWLDANRPQDPVQQTLCARCEYNCEYPDPLSKKCKDCTFFKFCHGHEAIPF